MISRFDRWPPEHRTAGHEKSGRRKVRQGGGRRLRDLHLCFEPDQHEGASVAGLARQIESESEPPEIAEREGFAPLIRSKLIHPKMGPTIPNLSVDQLTGQLKRLS
jgi:hypothetical protein